MLASNSFKISHTKMYNVEIHVVKNSIIVIFLYHKRHIVELACESVMWYKSDVKVIIENFINRITSDALDDPVD